MDDIPYLLRGITQMTTASSTLISSSRYLNHPKMREWVAQELLRKNGPDLPTPSGAFQLSFIIKEMQNYAEIDAMMEEERKHNEVLDRFLSERFVSNYTLESLSKYPTNSVAGLFYKQLSEGNYQVNIVPPYEPKGNYDYFLLRSGQTHDLEHVITAGGFDSLGEVVVGLAKLENIYKHFSPELANEMAVMQFFASFRFISRMACHYPAVWHDMWAAVDRGRKVGMTSDCYVLAKYEDVFHLTPEEARKALGVRNVEVVDTTLPSWLGREGLRAALRRIARAISGLVLLICANSAISVAADPTGDQKTVLIKLERSVCFGTCPAYSIELSGDGTVDYRGEQFVLVKGRHTRMIAPAVVASLLDKFRAADFWSLRPRYIARVTDNPEYRVTLTIGGQTKSVIDYVGRDAGMPESVTELEAEIDRVAGSQRWTQGNSETFPSLRDEHFDFHSDEAAEMLSVSIENANSELTHGLMDAGAMDSQPAKDAALMSATASGDLRLVAYILRRGANPNGQDSHGRTAIMRIEYRPHSLLHLDDDKKTGLEMISMLVAAGADPNVPDKAGNTALHLVDTKGLVPVLIKAGAQLEWRNVANETPLLTASSEDVALALIAAGADIDARDDKGHGLLEKARARYWNEVVAKIEVKQSAH